jgi:hypothetical protein
MFIAIAILLSYSIALVVAGHGALPMAIVLVFGIGSSNYWIISGTVAGWIGIVGLVFATFLLFLNPLRRLNYQFLASTILYLSWLVIAISGNDESGSLFSSFVLSAPFQITFFFVAYRFFIQRQQASEDLDNVL